MEQYDVLIVGAATSGAYFAHEMAKRGHRVKVIEKQSFDDFGRKYDIFHISRADFDRFGLPLAVPGDGAWAFEFHELCTSSPTNRYPKRARGHVVGLHMHEYIVKMNRWAKEAGAEFAYGVAFEDFLWENGKIAGARCRCGAGEKTIRAKVVVDCSGIPSVARRKLPDDYGVENFAITPEDMFYVILWYVKLRNESDYLTGSCGWPFYKSWIAPQADPTGAILGVGATGSYAHGEAVFADLQKTFELPEHTVTHREQGCTPYCRSPYSFVADNFIAAGDAACMTKPDCGEGVTSSMVMLEIAASVLEEALRRGDISKERLWPINVAYNRGQGGEFAETRALFTKAVRATKEEFDYFFAYSLIFKDEKDPLVKEGSAETGRIIKRMLLGFLQGKLSGKTLWNLAQGMSLGGDLKKHYSNFPESPEGYANWTKKAEKIWRKVGKMQ